MLRTGHGRAQLLGTALLFPGWTAAYANPGGGHVVSGQASISTPNASTVDVTQTSQDAVINWQSFSIAAGQTTQFRQPDAAAVTLNRVTGSDLSTIAGRLRANGTVILINQSGIVFADGAQVDTNGLIATTADISKQTLASGRQAFTVASPNPRASVVNRGRITVAQAGLAALVAPSVANSGVISATLGRVVLGGAKTFTVDLYGDGLVSFDVGSRVAEVPVSAGGTALVSNTGQISADGGHILLTADAVDGIIGDLVSAGGSVQARAVGGTEGSIAVAGIGQGGLVTVTGRLDASGRGAGQRGGSISVLGDRVGLLAGASLDASGEAGGGQVLVGGNFHGRGTQQQARITYIAATAEITADALGRGNGGDVAVWSDQQTAFYGSISARGGVLAGDGGYVEVSGENLDFAGSVDRSAPFGHAGTLLLDPAVVNIDDITSTANNNNLLPTILASEDPGATDHITTGGIGASLETGNVFIAATGSINVNSAISNPGTANSSFTLQAPTINLAADISNGVKGFGGDISLLGSVVLGSATGTVNLTAGRNLTLGPTSGPDVLNLSAGTATLNGVQVTYLPTGSVTSLVLNSGTYTASCCALTITSPATTNGTLTLGSVATFFGSITLGSDTVLNSVAANGIITIASVNATAAYGQGLTILGPSIAGSYVEVDTAGTTEPLSTLSVTGPTILGPQTGAAVSINADHVLISGAINLNQNTTITTDASGTISLSNIVGTGSTLSLSAGTGGITLSSLDVQALNYTSAGPVTLEGGSDYDIAGASAGYTFGAVTLTGGDFVFAQPTTFGAVTLTGDTSFFSGTGTAVDLDLASLDSAGATAPNASFSGGALTLGSVGALHSVGVLTVDANGPTVLSGNINAQSVAITSPVTLAAAVTVDAPGGAAFGTVDAVAPAVKGGPVSGALVFTADTGAVTLGNVGGNVPLNALSTVSTTSTTTLSGDVAAGAVEFAGAVALAGTIAISTTSAASGTGPITLGPLSGATSALKLSAGAGTITLAGFDVSEFTETTTGVTFLDSGTYTATGGPLSFGNVVTGATLTLGSTATAFNTITLTSDAVLDATTAGGGIAVGDAEAKTAYGESLKILVAANAPNASITLDDAGLAAPLGTLTTSGPVAFGAAGGGPVSINADTVNIQNQAALNQSTAITTDAGGSISLADVIGSASTGLTLSAGTGGISLNGVTAESLAISAIGTVTLNPTLYDIIGSAGLYSFGNVTLEGVLQFAQTTSFGAVVLSGPTIISVTPGCGCAIDFNSIDSANPSSPQNATIVDPNISGLSIFAAAGATNPLGTLTIDIGGNTTVFGNVSAQNLAILSPLVLAAQVTMDAPGGASLASVDSSNFGSGGIGALSFTADSGNVTLGAVGANLPLGSLTDAATSSTLTLTANVAAGAVSIAGPVTLTAPVTIDTTSAASGAGPIALGPVNGAGFALSLTAGAGDISLSGFDVSSFTETTSGATTLNGGTYTVSAGTLSFGNVATSGDLIFGQPTSFGSVALLADTTLDASAVNGELTLGQVTGNAALTVNTGSGGVTFAGVAVNALTVTGTGPETLQAGTYAIATSASFGTVQLGGDIVLDSPQTSIAAATLIADTTLDSSAVGGNITLGPVSGASQQLTLNTGAGTLTLAGAVVQGLASTAATEILDSGTYTVAGGLLNFGTVETNGTLALGSYQTSFAAMRLASDTVLDTGGIGSVVIGEADATSAYGQALWVAGTLALGGAGANVPLKSLTVSGQTDLSSNGFGTPGIGTIAIDAGTVNLQGDVVPFQTTSMTTNASGTIGLGYIFSQAAGVGMSLNAGTGGVALNGLFVDTLSINSTGPVTLASGDYEVAATHIAGPNYASATYAFGPVTTTGTLVFEQSTSFASIALAGPTSISTDPVNPYSLTLGPVSGQAALTVTSAGTLTLDGVAAGGLVAQATGAETLNAGTYAIGSGPYAFGNVTTNGSIALGQATSFGSIALAADTKLDSSAANAPLTLGQVTGNQALAVSTGSGAVTFDGVNARALTVTGTGIETLQAGTYAISTSASFGTVQVGGDIVLASPRTSIAAATMVADTTLDSSSVNGNLVLGPVGGAFALALDAGSGSIALNGVQVAGFNLSAGAITANTGTYNVPGGIDFLGAGGSNTVVTNGTLTLLGGVAQFPAVRLQSDTTIIGQVIISGDTDASTPYGQGLTVQTAAGGEFVFGNIGATTPLSALHSSTGANYDGFGSIIDAASVTLPNKVVVYGQTTITTNGTGGIVLGDATDDGGGGLSLNAGSGGVTLNGAVLDTLAITSSVPVNLDAGTYAVGPATRSYAFGAVSTSGSLRFGQQTSFGSIALAADTTLDSSAANALLTLGPVTGRQALTVTTGSGGVSLSGVTAAGLTVSTTGQKTLNAGTYSIGSGPYAFGNITANGAIVLGQATNFGAVTLAADSELDTGQVNAGLSFGPVTGRGFALEAVAGRGSLTAGAIDGVGSLVLSGGVVTLDGAIGSVTPAGSVDIMAVGASGLSLSQPVTATGSIVLIADAGMTLDSTLAAAGTLTLQAVGTIIEAGTGRIDAPTLILLAGGNASLTGANSIATLASALASTLTLDDAASLTVTGKVDTTGGIAIDPASVTIAGGASVLSRSGNVSLASEGGGDIAIDAPVSAAAGTLTLSAAGSVSEQGEGAIDALALTGTAGASATLGGRNQIAGLGDFAAGENFLLNDATALGMRSGATVSAGSLVTIADAASLSVGTDATVTGQNVALGAFGGALFVAGTLRPSADAYLDASAGLTLAATGGIVAGGSIRADAGGSADFAAGATLTAGGDVWIGYGASDTPQFALLGYTAPATIGGSLADLAAISASGNAGLRAAGSMTADAPVTAASLFLVSGGDLTIDGALTAAGGSGVGSGTVFLQAGGNIGQSDPMTGAVLVGEAGGSADLGGANRIGALGGFVAGSGFSLNDSEALSAGPATYAVATPVAAPGLAANSSLPSPLPAVTQAVSSGTISAAGTVSITAPGNPIQVSGPVAINAGSFIDIGAGSISQTGTLTLTAPLSLLDISGAPASNITTLFGADGATGIAAFKSGKAQDFLNRYETLVARSGIADPVAKLSFASLVAPLAGSHVVMAEDQGAITGSITAGGLALVSVSGTATLSGTIAGKSGAAAASLGLVSFGPRHLTSGPALAFDNCPLATAQCGAPAATPSAASAVLASFDMPLQPQFVADAAGTDFTDRPSDSTASNDAAAAAVEAASRLFRLGHIVHGGEFLGSDSVLREHAFDDLDVDRLNTGREDVK